MTRMSAPVLAIFAQAIASVLFAVIVSPLARRGQGDRLLRWWGLGWAAFGTFAAAAWFGAAFNTVDPWIRDGARLVMAVAGLIHPGAILLGALPDADTLTERRRFGLLIGVPAVVGVFVWLLAQRFDAEMMNVALRGGVRQLACMLAFGFAAQQLLRPQVASPSRRALGRLSAATSGLYGIYVSILIASVGLPLIGHSLTLPTNIAIPFALADLVLLTIGGALMIRLLVEDATRDARALRTATENWEQVVSIAPVGILTVTRDGSPAHVNDAARAILGDGAVRGPCLEPRSLDTLVASVLRGARLDQVPLSVPRQGRRDAALLVSAVPVRGDADEITGALVVLADRTALRELESLYARTQRMDAVGRVAGGVAHDFNNMLTIMISAAESLRLQLPAGDVRHGDVGEILSAGERAAALTRRLLTFARPGPTQDVVTDLNGVISDLVTLVRRMRATPIEIVLDLGPDLPAIRIDRTPLEQVVMNLCVNARDAMPTGGTLTLRTRTVCVTGDLSGIHSARTNGRWVAIDISDTGTGIAPEVAEQMFEPLFTTKAAGEGTGLGLATVYGILERVGGQLQVSSTVGVGTTFTIFLAAAAAATVDAVPV